MTEFVAWSKTARYFRDIVITEKIDGTNAAIVIEEHSFGTHVDGDPDNTVAFVFGPNDYTGLPVHEYLVFAQSRNRMITPAADNAGFARWVSENADTLVADLGPGRHYGEWWGQGIQRKYGMDRKVFSLFNTRKWDGCITFRTPNLSVVPILYQGPHREEEIRDALEHLRDCGSIAAAEQSSWWFMNPEGICIFHTASNTVYKVTLQDDETPKSLVAVPEAA